MLAMRALELLTYLYELFHMFSYVSVDYFYMLHCIHNSMGTFDLHGLIVCVSEGVLSE